MACFTTMLIVFCASIILLSIIRCAQCQTTTVDNSDITADHLQFDNGEKNHHEIIICKVPINVFIICRSIDKWERSKSRWHGYYRRENTNIRLVLLKKKKTTRCFIHSCYTAIAMLHSAIWPNDRKPLIELKMLFSFQTFRVRDFQIKLIAPNNIYFRCQHR